MGGRTTLHPHSIFRIISVRAALTQMEAEVDTPFKRTIRHAESARGDRQFVAEWIDLPVVTQAATLDELASNIREAIGLQLEGEDLAVLGYSSNPAILATMELEAVA